MTLVSGPFSCYSFKGRVSLRDSPVTFDGYVSDPAEGHVEKGD